MSEALHDTFLRTSADAPDCPVCEVRHPYGTPHPDRIHPGPRTVKAWIAVRIEDASGRCDVALVGTDRAQAERFAISLGRGAVVIEADIPIEQPTIESRVVQSETGGAE